MGQELSRLLNVPQVRQATRTTDLRDITKQDRLYMIDWGKTLGFTEHTVCVQHSSQHAYGYEPADVTVLTTIDGTVVFKDSLPILSSCVFKDAHYGVGGGPNNNSKFDRKSIVKRIQWDYLQFYKSCEEADKIGGARPNRPDVIATRTTYCGN